MLLSINVRKRHSATFLHLAMVLIALIISAEFCHNASAAERKQRFLQKTFTSPEDAVKDMVDAVKANDDEKLLHIFGPDSSELISSGDEVADKNRREKFLRAFDEKNKILNVSDKKAVLEVGNDSWPLPIPVVKVHGSWRFDTKAGKEEILDRRIGENELSTIQVCLAYVDAQREYASKDRLGDGSLEYAQKFMSTQGKKDGLFWVAGEGEEQSPLGPLVAEARKEGYTKSKSADHPNPYHGYFYRILKAQGKDAPRGAYAYVVNGKMVGGFAMVAYPAEYGSSGIMTFIVSHDGVIYQKDLGRKTPSIAQSMKIFNPDKSWRKVEGKDLEKPGPEPGA